LLIAGTCGASACDAEDAGTGVDGGVDGRGDGGSDAADTGFDGPALLAFEVKAVLTVPSCPAGVCTIDQNFTLALDTINDVITMGAQGVATVVHMSPTATGWSSTSVFDPHVRLASQGGGASCKGPGGLRYTGVDLSWSAGVLGATVKGEVFARDGDSGTWEVFTGTWTGTPDVTAPSLQAASAHPLDAVELLASEPLPRDSNLVIEGPEGFALRFSTGEGPGARFFEPRALRFGTKYSLHGDPTFHDFAGLAGRVTETTTLSDPGILESGDFEGTVAAFRDGAEVVDASKAPPLAGQRSLYLPPGYLPARFTARLTAPAGAVHVVLTVSTVRDAKSTASFLGRVRLAAPLAQPQDHDLPTPVGPFTDLPGGAFVAATPVVMTLPLPPGTTDEVDVDIRRVITVEAACSLPGLFAIPAGLLVDDVRVE